MIDSNPCKPEGCPDYINYACGNCAILVGGSGLVRHPNACGAGVDALMEHLKPNTKKKEEQNDKRK